MIIGQANILNWNIYETEHVDGKTLQSQTGFTLWLAKTANGGGHTSSLGHVHKSWIATVCEVIKRVRLVGHQYHTLTLNTLCTAYDTAATIAVVVAISRAFIHGEIGTGAENKIRITRKLQSVQCKTKRLN